MAFIKKKSNLGKTIGLLFAVVALVCVAFGGYYFFNNYIYGIKKVYEIQIYKTKRHVYIARSDISFGSQIKKELLVESDITSSLAIELYMTESDIGKFAKSNIVSGVPVMKYMISDEKIQNDVREQEFNMFLLQSNLQKDDFIDLRIMYPNGEDFIVLSKKKIRDIKLAQNTVWCWLDERELLTVSSSIVDAYINKGAKLYVVTYVEPSSQKDSIPTYPANVDVMRVMASDPNIVDKAKLYLAEQVRTALDARLKGLAPEVLSKVQSEVSKEASSMQGTIQKDAQSQGQSQSNSNKSSITPIPTTTTPQNVPTNVPQSNPESNSNKQQVTTNSNGNGGAKSGFFD